MRPRLQRLGQDTIGVKVVYALDKQDDTMRACWDRKCTHCDIREVTQTKECWINVMRRFSLEEVVLSLCDEWIVFNH